MQARRHLATGALGVGALALVLAGCSDDGDGGAAAPTAPASVVTVTETVSASPTASASASATKTSTAGNECGPSDLSGTVVAGDAGAGQRRATLVLTNTSEDACTITGYPGLQLTTSSGAKVPTKTVRVSTPAPKKVTVAPGASAAATLTFGVVPAGSEPTSGPCEQEASKLRVIPPDARTAVVTDWDLGPVCNKGKISVNAFVASRG